MVNRAGCQLKICFILGVKLARVPEKLICVCACGVWVECVFFVFGRGDGRVASFLM